MPGGGGPVPIGNEGVPLLIGAVAVLAPGNQPQAGVVDQG